MTRRFQTAKKKKDGNTAPMDAALRYLGYAARTVREVERRLDECQYGEVEIMETVNRLIELDLLNDESYCEAFISSRLAAKPVSRRHLRDQLLSHEADGDAIEAALDAAIDEETEKANALAVAEKYARQFEALPEDMRRDRVQSRLISRGYDFDMAGKALRMLSGKETE